MSDKNIEKPARDLPTITPCPVSVTVKVMGGKWKPGILWELSKREKLRFGELQQLIPEVSPKMLTQQLRELEQDGVVDRHVFAEVPPRVEYQLNELGESLYPILYQMSLWGIANNTEESKPTASRS